MQRARSFNGTTDGFRVDPFPNGVYPVSFSVWINQSSLSAAVLLMLASGVNDWLRIECDGTGHGAVNASATTGSNVITSTTMSTNAWNLISATCTSATDRAVFLNGAGKGADATSKQPVGPLSGLGVGCITLGTPSAFFAGLMAQAAVYPGVPLADGAHAALYNGTRPETFGGLVLDFENMRSPTRGALPFRVRSTLTIPNVVGASNGPPRVVDSSPFSMQQRVRRAVMLPPVFGPPLTRGLRYTHLLRR